MPPTPPQKSAQERPASKLRLAPKAPKPSNAAAPVASAKASRRISAGPAALMRIEEIHRRIRAVMRDTTGRTRVSARSLAEEWQVSINTVRDALFLLEVFKAPLDYDQRRKTLYYLNPHYELRPPLFLSDRHRLAVLAAIRVAATSRTFPMGRYLVEAFDEISPLLAGAGSFGPNALDPVFSTADHGATQADAEHFTLICQAIVERREVRMTYRKAHPEAVPETRLVHPLHWFLRHDACLLVAHDPTANDRRNFELLRMEGAELTGNTFTPPANFDLRRYLSGGFGRFIGEPVHQVRVVFDRAYVPFLREREWQPGQVLVERPDGSAEVTFFVCHTAELEQYVLRTGGLAEVVEPADVRARVRAAAEKIAARHR